MFHRMRFTFIFVETLDMLVVKIVDQDVSDKIDTQYISEQLPAWPNIGITYVCTSEGGEEAEWMEDGVRYIVIHLPYDEVRQLPDVRPMMLMKAKERLGLVA